jgi:hypothetical protein
MAGTRLESAQSVSDALVCQTDILTPTTAAPIHVHAHIGRQSGRYEYGDSTTVVATLNVLRLYI